MKEWILDWIFYKRTISYYYKCCQEITTSWIPCFTKVITGKVGLVRIRIWNFSKTSILSDLIRGFCINVKHFMDDKTRMSQRPRNAMELSHLIVAEFDKSHDQCISNDEIRYVTWLYLEVTIVIKSCDWVTMVISRYV